ncbi:MAG TPA: allantoicase [Jatrophihabitans sp.]
MEFRTLPDLAVRSLGGSVVYANDELFAERENLINPGPAQYQTSTFGHKGQVYDGWETRRRRESGHDEAIVRLGAAGIIRGVIVDTAWFKGNYPPEVSVEAACVEGYPSPDELRAEADWQLVVPRSAVKGDTENPFEVHSDRRWTHVRLSIYPDGGVARLRVHGEVIADPALLGGIGAVDLAALDNGALVASCSNMFYSSPNNLISPGLSRTMGEGWETARRRDNGNDWVCVRLAGEGIAQLLELDTSYFVGNAPGWASVRGCLAAGSVSGSVSDSVSGSVSSSVSGSVSGSDWADGGAGLESVDWIELLPRTRLQPDTRHRFPLRSEQPISHIRLDIYPDGGMARLRLLGQLTESGIARARQRWQSAGG